MAGADFDPSGVSPKNGRFFGFPYSLDEAEIVIFPVPWDVTTSYRAGTSLGPEAILNASVQLDFFSPFLDRAWETKIGSISVSPDWFEKSRRLRSKTEAYLEFLEQGNQPSDSAEMQKSLTEINDGCAALHSWVEKEIGRLLHAGKKVITVGGDHSVSYGAIKALSSRQPLSLLHFDAHADLRPAYEGFPHSHASVMYNVLKLPNIQSLTQVGIRDVSPLEVSLIRENPKVRTFFDWDLKANAYQGMSWSEQCDRIVSTLTDRVYVSFDIDGLDPKLCPNTGTPVPGGLELDQVTHLLRRIVDSGRKIIGADLVEVAPGHDEWDGNVGARALFQLCVFCALSARSSANG